jgi:spermidine synthase
MQRSPYAVATLLFFSGFCALIYQTAWMRQFRLIFGASTLATAAVLAIFMGGLGLGSALLGRRADAHPNPLRLYATLELLIAASTAVSPLLLWIAGKVYIALGGSVVMGSVLATIVRLILATLVLGMPMVLMGGTLPAAARAVETAADPGRRRLALLYGVNTLGAVAGTLLSTFWMLELFGNRKTLLIAVTINALVGMTARALSRDVSEVRGGEAPAARERAMPSAFVYAAAAAVGFAFLLMELVWYRMLAPILGGSTFTFGLILATALLGIALGGAAYSFWSGGGSATAGGFALTCTLEAAAMLLPFALGDRLAVVATFLRTLGHAGFGGYVTGWAIVTFITVLPAAFVSGVQFPLLIALLGRGGEDVGQHVGRAYAWNTLGAIAGSLAGGFGFLPLFTATGCWKLAALLLGIAGIAAAAYAMRRGERVPAIASGVAAIVAVLFGAALGPTALWRHTGIGAGRSGMPQSPIDIMNWAYTSRLYTIWQADGRESAVALVDRDETAFIVNGKSDGALYGDAGTQVMAGLVGAMLHPNPRTAMVIGLGTGSTAGWLGAIPSMQQVTVAELEPAILHVAKVCTPGNHDVLHNPKVRIRIGDAREVLLTTPDRFDIIFSEPSNPYRAGIASLFTREFYETARAKLHRGGIFLQWVQAYDIDSQTVRTIYATLGSVFPQVVTWRTGEGDMLLVATEEPITIDMDALRRRVASEPFRTAMHVAWRTESAEGFLSHFIAADRVARAAGHDAQLNTDDQTLIEFGFARSLGESGRFEMDDVIRLANAIGAARPERIRGAVDWHAVGLERASQVDVTPLRGIASREEVAHHDLASAWSHADFRGVVSIWNANGQWQPVNSQELVSIAESLAESNNPVAMHYAGALRPWEPIEADAIASRLLLRQGRAPESAALLRRALLAWRTDMWPQPDMMERAVGSAVPLAAVHRELAPALYDALTQPFAAGQAEMSRLQHRFAVAQKIERCGPRTIAAMRAFEPWVPWNREYLTSRVQCYEKAGLRAMAERAREDLGDFLADEPQPLTR